MKNGFVFGARIYGASTGISFFYLFFVLGGFDQKTYKKPSALAHRRLQRATNVPVGHRQSLIIATSGATL